MTNGTKNYYTTSSNYADHTRFGGLINYSDFNTNHRGNDQRRSSIAEQIASDWKFDNECRQNIENRKWRKEHSDERNK